MDKPAQEPNTNSCVCSQKLSTTGLTAELPVTGTPGSNADNLANALGVSPLYRQQDSARWSNA